MPGFNAQTCGDGYTDACTIENVWTSGGGWFVVSTAGVFVQLQYGTPANPEWTAEQQLGTGAQGTVPAAASGIRFRNSLAGTNATVTAFIGTGYQRPLNYNFELEPTLSLTSQGSLNVTSSIGFQHNDVLVANESAVDFEDSAGNLAWTVADDAPNSRVKVTPTVTGLQGNPVKSGAPSENQALVWNAGNADWEATSLTAAMVANAADKSSASEQDFTAGLTAPFFLATTAAIGYGNGFGGGGTVTQITSRSTAVTINKFTGTITTAANSGSGVFLFTVTNSKMAALNVVVLALQNGDSNFQAGPWVNQTAAGSFQIGYALTGTSTTAYKINFAIIDGSNN